MTKPTQTRFSLAQVNELIAYKGLELVKGDGYFYFSSDTLVHLPPSVMVNKLRDITLDQWLEAADVDEVKPKARRGIGKVVCECIADGLSNDEILENIQNEFPGAKTTKGCISWYRSKMKKAEDN